MIRRSWRGAWGVADILLVGLSFSGEVAVRLRLVEGPIAF
jgi:hypothetical protein